MKTLAASFLRRLRRIPTYAAILARRFGRWLRKEPWTKLGSLALAVLIFLFLHLLGPKIEERKIRIKVEPDSLAGTSNIVARISAPEVTVTLKGPADQIKTIDPDKLLVRVKPGEKALRIGRSRKETGEHEVKLKENLVERTDGVSRVIPDGVRMSDWDPTTITLTIEEQCSHPFEIALPDIVGEPIIGTVNTNAIEILGSRTIEVEGPSNIVQRLYDNTVRIATASIDVSKRSQTFEESVDLLPPTDLIPYIKELDRKVRVRIPIDDETMTIPFSNILVKVAAVADGERIFTCSPTNVSVTVSGSRTNVESVGKARLATNIVALVSGDDLAAEEGSEKVHMFFRDPGLYATLRLHDPEPSIVTVRTEKVDRTPPAPLDLPSDLLFVAPADAADSEEDGPPAAPAETPADGTDSPAAAPDAVPAAAPAAAPVPTEVPAANLP